jgi:hypothetical protein
MSSTQTINAMPADTSIPQPHASGWALSMNALVPFLLAIVFLFRFVTPAFDSLRVVQLWVAFLLGMIAPLSDDWPVYAQWRLLIDRHHRNARHVSVPNKQRAFW